MNLFTIIIAFLSIVFLKYIIKKDTLLFIKNMIVSPKNTGSIVPSSIKLSQKIIQNTQGESILLIGCGTGVMMEEIIISKKFKKVDIVEIDKKFYDHCKYKLDKLKKTYPDQDIEIFHSDILDYNTDFIYDNLLTTIPHKLINKYIIWDLCKKYVSLANRILTFEYIIPSKMQRYLTNTIKHHAGDRYKSEEFKKVLWNIPPASIRIVSLDN